MASTIEIQGLDERIAQLGKLSTKSPLMQQRIRQVIRQTMAAVRKALQNDARSGLDMKTDMRKAYKAVRYAVYRRIFGGQVNILQSRRAGAMTLVEPKRKGGSGRGGNRRPRSMRTIDLMSYSGKDRGFILRFLNAGTKERHIRFKSDPSREDVHRGSRGGDVNKYGKTINTGYRGAIAPRNWFGQRSQQEMEIASRQIDQKIDEIIQGIMF